MIGPGAPLALAAALLIPASPARRLGHRAAGDPKAGRSGAVRAAGFAAVAPVAALAAALAARLPVTGCLAIAVLGVTVGLRRRRHARHRHGVAEAHALQAALDVVVGELRIGADPVRAFEVAAAETGHAGVAGGLRAVAARARLGADVAAGLRGVAASSSRTAQWERLAVYWQLGSEHGLAIAGLMHAAQRDITERQRFSSQVRAGMAGARASAAILAALPALGVLLGQLIGAHPVRFLLTPGGGWLLLAGVILVCAGLLWSDRITGRLT